MRFRGLILLKCKYKIDMMKGKFCMPTKEELLEKEEIDLIEKTLLMRTEFELYRKEKHSNARLIADSDYTPEQFVEAFKRSQNDCISMRDENKKNEDIPEFKIRKMISVLSWIIIYGGVFTLTLLRMYKVNGIEVFKEISTIVVLIALALIMLLPVLLISYLSKFLGMPPFNAFLRGNTKFYRMNNGQIAFVDLSEKGYPYPSVFENLSVLRNPKWEDAKKLNKKNTEIMEMYIPTKIISVKMTRNGILLESSGKFYGIRKSYITRYGSTKSAAFHFEDWSEMDIDYRKELIPVTWINIEGLFRELQTYDNAIVENAIKLD